MRAFVFLVTMLSAATSEAQVSVATDVPLNQQVILQTPSVPVDQASAPKKLWSRWGKGEGPSAFIQVYRFTVRPGEKYTLYAWFKPDGVYRNFYAVGDNPLTNYEASFGKSGDYTKTFVALAQQPWKETCAQVTRRYNLMIAPDSTPRYLYLVVTSKTPSQAISVMLKTPPDPDADLERDTNDPACAARKGNTWGQVWRRPFLLQLDPSETGSR